MTKQFLVLPFLNLLGYNVFDPNEVMPEHHADFSDKYTLRVPDRVQPAMIPSACPSVSQGIQSSHDRSSPDRGVF